MGDVLTGQFLDDALKSLNPTKPHFLVLMVGDGPAIARQLPDNVGRALMGMPPQDPRGLSLSRAVLDFMPMEIPISAPPKLFDEEMLKMEKFCEGMAPRNRAERRHGRDDIA